MFSSTSPKVPAQLSLPPRFELCAKQGCRIMTRDLGVVPADDVPGLPHTTNDSNVVAIVTFGKLAKRNLRARSGLTHLPDNGILHLVGFTGMFPRTEFNVPATRNSRIVKWGAESGPVI